MTAEVASPGTTYDWFANLPLASSAGNTVYSWYESSKNCCRVSKFALGTVESSAKCVAGVAAPLVKKLDGPIHAADSFTLKQLVKLEEKVPSIKTQPNEVLEMIHSGKDAICTRLSDGKQAVYDRISDGKGAISSRITSGKDAISGGLTNGKNAICTRLEAGAEVLANTRAGTLVGSGVNRTLTATENFVDYLLPPEENEKGLLLENEVTEPPAKDDDKSGDEEEEEEEEEEEGEGDGEKGEGSADVVPPTRFTRVKTLSKKVRLRMYYRSLRKLHAVQQQCKTTLDHLKLSIDALKLAQSARKGVGRQYERAQAALKELEAKLSTFLSRKPKEETISWLPEWSGEGEGEDDIQWLAPKKEPKTLFQSSLDYAKQLNERVYGALQSVAGAASYLPHRLKGGTSQAFTYALELGTTLKSAKVPSDLPTSTLNRISEVVDTQLGYVHQLGDYLSSALQRRTLRRSKEEVEVTATEDSHGDSGSNTEEEEKDDEEDPSLDPAASRQPPPEQEEVSSSGEEDKNN